MMLSARAIGIIATVLLLSLQTDVNGQPSNVFVENYILSRTSVSPYLNLLRDRGQVGSTALYQTMVRPQLEARRLAQQQQRDLFNFQQPTATARRDARLLPGQQGRRFTTGNSTRFLNYGNFYPGLRSQR